MNYVEEKIKWYVFPPCAADDHTHCQIWQEGWVDGQLRRAGERCSCECHHKKTDKE